MSEPRNLLEKRNATVPGKWCDWLEELLYSWGDSQPLRREQLIKLRELCHYLESLAFAEIDKELPVWMHEWKERKKETDL